MPSSRSGLSERTARKATVRVTCSNLQYKEGILEIFCVRNFVVFILSLCLYLSACFVIGCAFRCNDVIIKTDVFWAKPFSFFVGVGRSELFHSQTTSTQEKTWRSIYILLRRKGASMCNSTWFIDQSIHTSRLSLYVHLFVVQQKMW